MRLYGIKNSKAGVSLITVLLFMLVATIAATATYKWLTSEGHSSASRMLQREAYQSSVAGIENARSWMTYNANDFGALVTQYFKDGKKAVLMNPVLRPLSKEGQEYDVWLKGVEVTSAGYRVQILSTGRTRNGTTHSEEAIFNVTGLYQVTLPKKKKTGSSPFHDALFGSLASAGNLLVSSATINGSPSATNAGGTAFTTVAVSDYLMVTGTAEFNSSTTVNDLYVAQGFSACANVTVNGNAYIGDKLYALAAAAEFTVHGDVYANHGVDLTQKPNTMGGCSGSIGGLFQIDGDLTSNGNFKAYGDNVTNTFTVDGNLVVKGAMKFPSIATVGVDDLDDWTNAFTFGKNAYIRDGFTGSMIDYSKAENLQFSNADADIHIFGMQQFTNSAGNTIHKSEWDAVGAEDFPATGVANTYAWCPYSTYACYYTAYSRSYSMGWFSSSTNYEQVFAQIQGTMHGTAPSAETLQEWTADNMQSYTSKLTNVDKPAKCKTDYYVKDPVQFNKDILDYTYVHTKTNPYGCSASLWNSWPSDWSGALNECYSTAATNKQLYENEWLVIELNAPVSIAAEEMTTPLNGHFIIIMKNGQSQTDNIWFRFPEMTSGSNAMVYLPDGWTQLGFKNGASSSNNYFIFSEGDIGEFQMGSVAMRGSVFMSDCAALNTETHNATVNIVFDQDFVDALDAAAIICTNDGTDACSSPEPGGDGGEGGDEDDEEWGANVPDTYHITMAPQLGITLESQYESKINSPPENGTTELTSSILVLPRIIYLTRDPVGKLEDYYSVINLNGATEKKTPSKVTCSPAGISNTALLYQDSHLLNEGIYTCTYASGNEVYGDVDFYLVVNGTSNSSPIVSFTEQSAEMAAGSTVPVSLNVPAFSHGEISVDIMVSSLPDDKWSIVKKSGVTEREGATGGTIYTVRVGSSTGLPVHIFDVKTESSAGTGTVLFQLIPPCDGCTIGNPSEESVVMTGTSTVERKELKDYCEKYPAKCTAENKYKEIADRPDCGPALLGVGNDVWIQANGTNCRVDGPDKNKKWKCATNTTISLSPVGSVNSNLCERVIPPDNNSISNPADGEPYTLYASLKRKKYTLTVNRKGATNSETVVKVYVSDDPEFHGPGASSPFECSDTKCEYSVYAGQYVKLEYELESPDQFSYWYSSSPNSPTTEHVKLATFTLQPISASNTVLAQFNDKDKHCFYDDFKNLSAFCNTKECIADCNADAGCAASADAIPNWQLSYKNGKSNVPPEISGGAIYSTNENNSNNQNKGQTLVLNNRLAGKNGVMTAMLQTTIFKENGTNNAGLNSGFVLRSDAKGSQYLILNIFGYGKKDGTGTGTLNARLCSVTGQGTNNSNNGCVESALSNQQLTISPTTMIKVQLTIENSTLSVVGTVNGQEGSTSFELSGVYALNGEYVGMKLSDNYFKLYDIGWESSSFPGEGCWEVPTISCSFKANYVGGIVPLGENVTPWAAASSWFENNNCGLDYYYSGADNGTSSEPSTQGGYSLVSSDPAGTYNFSASGAHGLTGPDTYNDAKIKVRCNGSVTTSLDKKETSCGLFQVGKIDNCSMDYDILPSTGNSVAVSVGEEEEIATPDATNGVNLREATLNFVIQDLGDNETITVYLKDKNGLRSLPGYIGENGTAELNVTVLSNVDGFDPQSVVSIFVSGTSSFTVTSIQSSCPYVFSIRSCDDIDFNGASWVIRAAFNNILGALPNGCSVTADNNITGLSNVACTNSGFSIADGDFYSRLNSGSLSTDKTFTFTVSAKNLEERDVPDCVATVTYSPNDIECSVADIVQGEAMPAVNFTIPGKCPDNGCAYTVRFGEYSATGNGSGSWTAPVENTNLLTTGDNSYVIESNGVTKTCTFNVAARHNASATCSVSNGVISGTITSANWGEPVPITVAVSSYMGNILSIDRIVANTTSSNYSYTLTDKNLTPGQKYIVTLTLNNGPGQKCGEYTPQLADLSLSGCPESASGTSTSFTPVVAGCNGTPSCHWTVDNDASVPEAYDGSEITISDAVEGTIYRLTLTRGTSSSEENYASTYCDIPFASATPTFSVQCNSGEGNTIAVDDVPENGKVEVTPYNVVGCSDAGCSYDITQNETSVYSGVQTGYTGGKVEFMGTSGNNVPYVLTINGPTGTTPQTCTFNVTYTSTTPEPTGCHCEDYCTSGCNNIITGDYNGKPIDGCYFVTDPSTISFTDLKTTGNFVKINGSSIPSSSILSDNNGKYQPCWGSQSTCESALSSYPKKDGGWYIYAKAGWAQLTGSGEHSCPPSVTCPADFEKTKTNGTITATPQVLGNCGSGCSYTVWKLDGDENIITPSVGSGSVASGGNISLSGENQTGNVKYKLEVSKGDNTAPSCTFEIDWINSNPKISFAYGDEKTITAGTYSVTCAKQDGSERKLVCKTTDGTTYNFTYAGSSATAYNGYGNASATCYSTEKTLTTAKTIVCKEAY